MAPEADLFLHSRDSSKALVYEIVFSPDLLGRIKAACDIRIAEVTGVINTLRPLLNILKDLSEEIKIIARIEKPETKDPKIIAKYNEDRMGMVEDLLSRWVSLKGEIVKTARIRRELVVDSMESIFVETIFLECDFERTERKMEVQIDNNLYTADIEELRRRRDGKVYAVIHTGNERALEEGLTSIIIESIQEVIGELGDSDRRFPSILEYVKDRVMHVRFEIGELLYQLNELDRSLRPRIISLKNLKEIEKPEEDIVNI